MKHLKTVREVIEFLSNYPLDSQVFVNMNPVNGGTFEYLVPHPENESQLNKPKNVAFITDKGW